MKNTGRTTAPAGRRSRQATASGRHKILAEEALELIAARFRVLAEPMRLKILHTLGRNEMTVGQLVEATEAGQANISKHLAVLADARLVTRRKEGLNVYYCVADQTVFDLCDAVCSSLGEKLSAQHDAVRHFTGA
jgi:DNA-binding transcriptional ArsR family regulator